MIITSTKNEKIKNIKKLRNNKEMLKEQKIIIEGEHLIIEAKKAGLLVETFSLKEEDFGVSNTVVSENVMSSLSNLSTIPGVIGICKFKNESNILGNKIILLDGIQDPGNLGTIIRSAKAFGFNDVFLSNTCVNKYNEKVIRATQGMIFDLNVITGDICEFIEMLRKLKYDLYATNVNCGIDVKSIKNNEKIAIIMGSEGSGVSNKVKELVNKSIYINMDNSCESLNVAVAASIIMYELNNIK